MALWLWYIVINENLLRNKHYKLNEEAVLHTKKPQGSQGRGKDDWNKKLLFSLYVSVLPIDSSESKYLI